VVPLAWLERDGLHADEPIWWYGAGALAEVVPPAQPLKPPIVTPLPSDKVRPAEAQLPLFDPAAKIDLLRLPADLLTHLSNDEKAILVLLEENGSARTSELAARLGKNPGRLNGLMRTLRRTVHTHGLTLFTDEILPSGETLYRYQSKEGR
jgi:hypothetical protein